MRQRDHLVVSGENYVVLADDCAAADSVHSYLVLVAGLSNAVAVVYEMILAAQFLVDCLGYHYCSAGRRVLLLIVVLLNDFNIELTAEYLSSLARKATQILGGQFDIEIVEKHHNQKKDAPSGTAIMIAEAINEELGGKDHFVYDRHSVRKPRDKDEIGMHAIRGGTIVGEHDIIFAGHDEVITLSHSAQSREVFANGAVNAAVFLAGKPAGMYAMSDLIKEG